jgi:hypothetical protein
MGQGPLLIECITFTGIGVARQMNIADDELDVRLAKTSDRHFSLIGPAGGDHAIPIEGEYFIESRHDRNVVLDDKYGGLGTHDVRLSSLDLRGEQKMLESDIITLEIISASAMIAPSPIISREANAEAGRVGFVGRTGDAHGVDNGRVAVGDVPRLPRPLGAPEGACVHCVPACTHC